MYSRTLALRFGNRRLEILGNLRRAIRFGILNNRADFVLIQNPRIRAAA